MDWKNTGKTDTIISMNCIDILRQNVFGLIKEKKMSICALSEKAGMPLSTLNALLYGHIKDMKLLNAVRLALALDISIDELIGGQTIANDEKRLILAYRQLSSTGKCFVGWYAGHLKTKKPNSERVQICVMDLELKNGYMVFTKYCRYVDITDTYRKHQGNIFCGFTIPCDYYMPHYCTSQIVLVANDRLPQFNEHCLIRIGEAVYIGRRRIENGIGKYYSIRDRKFRTIEENIDELIGYIVDVIDFSQVDGIV